MKRSPSTPKQRTKAEVYRNAARHMESVMKTYVPGWYRGACDNIGFVVHEDVFMYSCSEARRFEKAFRPRGDYGVYWGDNWGLSEQDRRNCRILALCFMAALVEAGDA